MIYQNNGKLRSHIQKSGCYMMSLIWHAVRFSNRNMNAELINQIYLYFILHDWMEEDCFIKKPGEIIAFVSGKEIEYLGWNDAGYQCVGDEFEILRFQHPDYGAHFVAGDGSGLVTYDPYQTKYGGSATVRYGSLVNKRVFRNKELS